MSEYKLRCPKCAINLAIDDQHAQRCRHCGATFNLLELEARIRELERQDKAAVRNEHAERIGAWVGVGMIVAGMGLILLSEGSFGYFLSGWGIKGIFASGLAIGYFYYREEPLHQVLLVLGTLWLAWGIALFRCL
jgi:hypothetical protein